MRIPILLNAALILQLSLASAADLADLPAETQALLGKLIEWEEEINKKFVAEVAAKRKQVTRLLDEQKDKQASAGNLEVALIIGTIATELGEATPQLDDGREFEELAGMWDWWEGREFVIIHEDGTVLRTPPHHHSLTLIRAGGSFELLRADGSLDSTLKIISDDQIEVTQGSKKWKMRKVGPKR